VLKDDVLLLTLIEEVVTSTVIFDMVAGEVKVSFTTVTVKRTY